MKCKIATEVNKGAHKEEVAMFGAKALATNSEVSVNPRNMLTITEFPSMESLNGDSLFNKGASYIFSNNSVTSAAGLETLNVFEDEGTMNKLIAAGANLYKDIADDFFAKNPSYGISPTPNNKKQFIFEGGTIEGVKHTNTRSFITITQKDINAARAIVEAEFGEEDENLSAVTKDQLFSEGVEFLLLSALYRGYDVMITGAIGQDTIESAIRRFSNLNTTKKTVSYASSIRSGKGITRAASLESFITSQDSPERSSKQVHSSNMFLKYHLNEDERTVYSLNKPATLMSKLVVANRIIGIFKDMMPNLNVKIISTAEIKMLYGATFAAKKNFIIDNTIILNQDKFSADTLFHEFSHYYSRWLSQYNPDVFSILMDNVKNNFSERISGYTSLYNSTGIFHDEDAIVEEIFADNLGMLAAKELEANLALVDPADSKAVAGTVDEFTLDFLKKLTKNMHLTATDTTFNLNSSISDIFNIGVKYSRAINPTSLISTDNESFENLRDFFIEKASPKDVFHGLVDRGFIRKVSNDTVILIDGNGNRVDANGNASSTDTYKVYPWDTVEHIKSNKKFLKLADLYLDRNKNYASVRFSIKRDPDTVEGIIRGSRSGLELTEDGANYQKDGQVFDRVTHFLQEQFSDKTESEMFILNEMYSSKVLKFKKDASKDIPEEDLNILAAQDAKEYMLNVNSRDFKIAYDKIAVKFDFKTTEGTYLHAIAEFFFRSLNYSNQIDFKTEVENPSPMYFADAIIRNISGDQEGFISYYENLYFNKLRGLEGTDDYKEFKKNFDFLVEAMSERSISRAPALKFLNLLKEKVIPVIGRLKGPITIMPEVKLSSKTMGVAGTIDLLVIDGDGTAHIFDYKTKQTTKEHFWDFKSSIKMKGLMGPYSENAKMKASIQTSIYKLMLMELGIQTGPANIFYVESDLPSYFTDKGITYDNVEAEDASLIANGEKNKGLRYSPKDILRKGVLDVSAELYRHFSEMGRKPQIASNTNLSAEITDIITKAAGGRDIDVPRNVTRTATNIYEKAIERLSGINVKDTTNSRTNVLMQSYYAKYGKDLQAEEKEKKGLAVKMPGGNIRYLDPKLNGRDEHIAAIEKVLLDKEVVRGLESDLISIFDGQDRTKVEQEGASYSGDRGPALRALVSGADVWSHEIVKLSSNASFGVDYSGIMMLRNKMTGEVRLIVLNADEDSEVIPFGGTDRANVWGNYITTNASRIALPTMKFPNTVHNMRLVKAGLIMVQQKLMDENFTISQVISNPGLSKGSNVPNLHDPTTILMITKQMLQVMKDAGEKLPESMIKALQRPELFESVNYVQNPINMLSEYLSTVTTGDYVRIDDLFSGPKAKVYKEKIKDVLDNYDPNQDNHKLIDALNNFRNSLAQRLHDSEQALINNDLYRLLDSCTLFLNNFNINDSPKNTSFLDNLLYTPSKISNKLASAFNRKTQDSRVDIRSEFMEYKNKHNKLLQALAKANGVNLDKLGPSLFTSSMKTEMFKNLYTTDNKDSTTAYILKDPSQVTKQAEKDYLIYLRDTFQKYADKASYRKQHIPYGWMPLMNKSKESRDKDEDLIEKARRPIKIFDFNGSLKGGEERQTIYSEFSVESKFAKQLPGTDASKHDQFSHGRRSKLFLDDTMAPTANAINHPVTRLEDNLENVMDTFVIDALDTFHYKDISEFGRSLFFTVRRYEALSKLSYSPVIDTIAQIQRRIVSHHDGDTGNKVISKINTFATNAAIAGTVTQALLETFANPMVTASNYLGDKLYGALFKGTREFSMKSYSKAFKLVAMEGGKTTKIIEAISNTYGITSSNTEDIKSMMNQLESNALFKSENLMYINKLMMESWQKITMVAYMIEQGSFFAHTINDDGDLIYDEKKDKRFHFSEPKTSKDYLYKKKFYAATKAELGKQRNGLNTNSTVYDERTLKRAWTTYDANHIKEIVVELYSSLDDTSKSLAVSYTYMSFIVKMKTWLFSKVSRYWQAPMTASENASAGRLVKVPDESAEGGYRLEWKGSETEGIMYTLWSMTQQLYEYKTEIATKGTLTDKQKKNLGMLAADLLTWSVLGAAASGLFKYALDDETRKDETVKLLYKRWMMATSDVFVLKSMLDMATGNGSMMVSLSILKRAVTSVAETAYLAPQVLFNPDVSGADVSSAAANMLKSTYGPFKSIDTVATMISPNK